MPLPSCCARGASVRRCRECCGVSIEIQAHSKQWKNFGIFKARWQSELAEYENLRGIAWKYKSIDGDAMMKTPLVKELVGANRY